MDISIKVKLRIGEVIHDLTIEELQALSVEIARLLPPQQLIPLYPITYPPYYLTPSSPSLPSPWWSTESWCGSQSYSWSAV